MANLEDLRIDTPVARPRRRRSNPWGLLFWLALAAGGGWYLLRDRLPQLPDIAAWTRQTAEVEVYTVPDAAAGPEGAVSAGGYLEVVPPGPVVASTLIPGKLLSVDVVEGERVRRGQLIARLDAGLYQQQALVLESRVALARAELSRQQAGFRGEEVAQGRADLASAQARLTRAEADFGREQQLFTAGVVPRSRLDETQSLLDQARADVQARQAQLGLLQAGTRREDVAIYEAALAAAQAELAQARYNVAQCAIQAPADGVVYQQLAQPGDWLAPDSGERSAGGVASIFDPRQIQAWCDVNQRDSTRITLGQQAQLTTDALPQRQIPGVVSAVMPRANLQKNTVQVKVRIPDPPEDLRPELALKVTFLPPATPQDAPRPAGVPVPAGAVVERAGAVGVFVISAGKAAWRSIEREVQADGAVRVLSGLSPGEQVVLNPAGLADGQNVQLKAEGKK